LCKPVAPKVQNSSIVKRFQKNNFVNSNLNVYWMQQYWTTE
jgi:hypothetical protein